MANQQAGHGEVAANADELSGQNKRNKDDEFLDQVSDALMREAVDNLANSQADDDQPLTYTSQAAHFLQQAGEQVKTMAQGAGEQVMNMAQGASEAMRSTIGMNDNPNAGSTGATENPGNSANSCGTTTAAPSGQQQP